MALNITAGILDIPQGGTSAGTTIIVGRNAQNIVRLAEDMTVNILNASLRLVFGDATRGWIII